MSLRKQLVLTTLGLLMTSSVFASNKNCTLDFFIGDRELIVQSFKNKNYKISRNPETQYSVLDFNYHCKDQDNSDYEGSECKVMYAELTLANNETKTIKTYYGVDKGLFLNASVRSALYNLMKNVPRCYN